MGLTSRLAGWVAGRVGGTKAKKGTEEWMKKTGLGQALGFAGDLYLGGKALKGLSAAGRGMGLLKAKGAATGVGTAAGAVPRVNLSDAELMREFGQTGAKAAGGASRFGNMAAAAGRGVGRVTDYLGKRPEIVGQALMAGATARTGAANRELEREALAQRESQFERQYQQSEQERQREIERQRRIAELLAPVFQRVAGGQG